MRRVVPVAIGTSLAVLVVAVAVFILLYGGAGAPDNATSPSASTLPQVAAIVNGEAITRDMVEAEIKISRLNIIEPLPPLTGEDLARATEEAVNQLITRHLILQAAARQNFVLDDDFVNSRVKLLFGAYGDEALAEALKQAGAGQADLVWWVREIFTVEEFTTKVIMAGAAPGERQLVYNDWLNTQRAAADIKTFLNGEEQTLPALVGQPAPDFTLTTLDGQQVSLSDYAGRVVLVNFWATWCPSCLTEMPDYEQVYRRHGQGQGDFVVLGVNLQEGPEQVSPYANGLGLTFPVLLDRDGNVTSRRYQVTGMPASFIVDRQGLIFYRHLGPMSGQLLQTRLAELGL